MRGRKLGRTTAHRTAMFRNQLTALFTHERITTTVAKAKALRPVAERMVTLARTGTLANRRAVLTMVPDKEVVRRLFDDIAPRFAERPGGYTRILRLGQRRGDAAEMAIIELVDFTPKAKGEKGDEGGKTSLMDRAKGLFGGGRQDAAPETGDGAAEAEAAPDEEPKKVEAADEPAEPEPKAEAAAEDEPEPEAEAEPEGEIEAEAAADEAPEKPEPETAADTADSEDETDAEKKADT
jgi:large subunit ribosomal protein L17